MMAKRKKKEDLEGILKKNNKSNTKKKKRKSLKLNIYADITKQNTNYSNEENKVRSNSWKYLYVDTESNEESPAILNTPQALGIYININFPVNEYKLTIINSKPKKQKFNFFKKKHEHHLEEKSSRKLNKYEIEQFKDALDNYQ